MRRLTAAEYEFLRASSWPCLADEGGGMEYSCDDDEVAAGLAARGTVILVTCRCGDDHFVTTELGRLALRIEAKVRELEGPVPRYKL